MLSYDDSECPVVVTNICKYQNKWGNISRILVYEGSNMSILGKLYTSVVEYVFYLGQRYGLPHATLIVSHDRLPDRRRNVSKMVAYNTQRFGKF